MTSAPSSARRATATTRSSSVWRIHHDLIQTCNHDPHWTGVGSHSHNAFCSRCHSPYRGEFLEAETAQARRVFSEEKETISCVACHDPHDSTHAGYRRE